MKSEEIIEQLRSLGNESIKKTLIKHGAREPFFGVKVEDLKKIQKKIKKDYQLSLELFDSDISDAMYLAGLIADEAKMTKEEIQHWAEKAYWYMITEYPVAWVAAGSRYGRELALDWINSDKENIATAGWATLSRLVSVTPDKSLNIEELEALLDRVAESIHDAPNRVRYTMNGFVIAAGVYVKDLTEKALQIAHHVGKVKVDMGGTACKVPFAIEYINKMKTLDKIGQKRKELKC